MTGVYQPGPAATPGPARSEHVATEVLVAHQVAESLAHVRRIHNDGGSGELLSPEGHVLEHLLHDREEAAGAEVLVLLVDAIRLGGELADAVRREVEGDLLGTEQGGVLPWSAHCPGSVRMRTRSSSLSGFSSTRMGNRPWNSGMRSLGRAAVNAPAAMNRTWSVRTGP